MRELAGEQDAARLFAVIGERACRLLGADGASLVLVEGGEAVLRAAYGVEPGAAARPAGGGGRRGERPGAPRFGYRAVLEAPLRLDGAETGVLTVFQRAPRVFSPGDVALLGDLAHHVALALDRIRLREALGGRLRETETLLAVSRAVSTTSDLTEMLRRVAREAGRALAADTAGAFLADGDGSRLRPVAGYHVPRPLLERGLELPIGEGSGFFAEAWGAGRAVAAADAAADPRLASALGGRLSARALVFAPMVAREAPIGGLLLAWWRARRDVSADERRLLEGIGRQAGLAVANARLLQTQQEDAEVARALLTLAEAIGGLAELDEVLGTVARVTPQLLGLTRCALFLWDAAAGRLVPAAAWGLAPALDAAFRDLRTPAAIPALRRAVESQEPVAVNPDALAAEVPAAIAAALDIRSVLVVPLVAGGRLMGAMAVDRPGIPHVFAAQEVAIARGVAAHAAVAIQKAGLYAETARRRHAAEVLADVGRLLSETLEPEVVGRRIAEGVRTLLGVRSSTLYRLDDAGAPFEPVAVAGDAFPRGSGIVRAAVESRQPVATPDLLADPRATPTPAVRAALEPAAFRAVLAVPLTVKDRVIGALAVADRTGRVFDAEATALARLFADQAAIALENARLFRETGERLRETETLLEVAQIFSRSLPREEAMRRVARAVARAFGADMAGAYFLAPGTETLVPVAGYRVPKPFLPALLRLPLPLGRFPILQEAWATGRPVWTADYAADPRVDPELLAGMQPRSVLFAPTPVRGEAVGGLVLVWWTAAREITPAEARLIQGVAAQVGLALENAELGRQTEEKLRETEMLLSVTRAVSSTLDLQPLLRHFLRQVARTSGADSVGVWLLDEATGELEPYSGYRVPREILAAVREYRIRPAERGFYAEAIASGRPLVSTDVPGDPRIPASLKAIVPHRTQLVGPIVTRQGVAGAFIAIWYERTREFSARELALIEAMGGQAGVALENARLFQANQRRLAELSVLYELSRAVTGQLDVDELVRTVHQQIGRVLDARNMVIFLFDETRTHLEAALRMFDGAPDPNPVRRYPLGFGLMSRVVARRAPLRTTDYVGACRAEGVEPIKTSATLPHWLGVPMIAGDETLGVLALRDASRPFTDADEQLLANIGGVVALALRAARLFAEKTRAHDELRAAQDQLVRSEKLRALGEMAAGVAHDFNNILAAIMGRAQLLLSQVEEPGCRRQLSIIERAAMDGARTVRRIQEFTRMRRARPFEPVDLNQIVEEVVEVTRSRWEDEAIARGLTYDVRVEPTAVPSIAADPGELREVITNMVLNALDAMPDGGRVTLSTAVEGAFVLCTVADTGIGMTEEVRQRVFDPFFTTKAEKGTGLGLSVAYGIVTRHGGEIEVRSRPWQGSAFTIRLPAARPRDPSPPRPAAAAAAPPARVLVIDDEENVRQVLTEMLMARGHAVAAFADGRTGLARFHEEAFDVVFTDLGLPGLSGWEVARVVKLRRPGVPVVLVTGWSDQIEPEDLQARGVDFIVAKPFEVEDVLGVLARALARPPTEARRG